jgi:hypothetical protein
LTSSLKKRPQIEFRLCSFDIHPYNNNIRDPRNKRMNYMTNVMMGRQQADQEIFAFDVSDEALEIAAGTENEKASYTLGACTGLSVCPG